MKVITIQLYKLIIKYNKNILPYFITNEFTFKYPSIPIYRELYFLKLNKQDYITYFINPLMKNLNLLNKKDIIVLILRLNEMFEFKKYKTLMKLKLLILYSLKH
jgi:hypothetical protein